MEQISRLGRAAEAMARQRVAALLIGPGADLVALTGYDAHPSERLTLLVARGDGTSTLIVPKLEEPLAQAAVDGIQGVAVRSFNETQDPYKVITGCLRGIDPKATIAVGDQLWATFLLQLQRALPKASWRPASQVTREVRMVKTADEVAALRRAGAAIDAVHEQVPSFLRPGRTEAEVGRDIVQAMLEEGHDEAAFVIVASGPNGASPHHDTSDRVIQAGDAVVVDIGGPVEGWYSDCTRNYVVGRTPDGYDEAFAVLRRAQDAAVNHVRPGVTAASVDAAARDVIREAGFGDAFIHRTGHGIGLEVHEEPYIVAGNSLVLTPGMTFSIEPGIYLEGRFGMRIEDIVVVADGGARRLNRVRRALVTVPA